MKESTELLDQIKTEAEDCLEPFQGHSADWQSIRRSIEKSLDKFITATTERHPLILPVIIEV